MGFDPPVEVKGDFRIDVVASKFQKKKAADTAENAKSRKAALKQRKLAGKEPGLWVYVILHSAFVDSDSECVIQAVDLDKTKLQKSVRAARLNPEGSLAIEVAQ